MRTRGILNNLTSVIYARLKGEGEMRDLSSSIIMDLDSLIEKFVGKDYQQKFKDSVTKILQELPEDIVMPQITGSDLGDMEFSIGLNWFNGENHMAFYVDGILDTSLDYRFPFDWYCEGVDHICADTNDISLLYNMIRKVYGSDVEIGRTGFVLN